jgi:hypothetical protein
MFAETFLAALDLWHEISASGPRGSAWHVGADGIHRRFVLAREVPPQRRRRSAGPTIPIRFSGPESTAVQIPVRRPRSDVPTLPPLMPTRRIAAFDSTNS